MGTGALLVQSSFALDSLPAANETNNYAKKQTSSKEKKNVQNKKKHVKIEPRLHCCKSQQWHF